VTRKKALRTSAMLAALFLVGAAFVFHGHSANAVDRAFGRGFPRPSHSVIVRFLAELGSADSLAIVGFVGLHAAIERRDRRALVFILAAAILVPGLAEFAAKPLVGRHNHKALTYPSVHTTAATTAAVMCMVLMHRWGRQRLLVRSVPLAGMVVASVTVGVVWLRWHWFTDALGGIAFGASGALCLAGALGMSKVVPKDVLEQ
jgi:membrane-associated phospholipid phosphatase